MRPVGDSFASWRAIQAPLCISCVCPRPCTTRTSRDRVSIRLGTAVPCKRCCLRPAVRFLAPGVEAASLPERRTSSCYARRCRGFARAAPLTRDASIATKASGAHLRLRPCNLSRVRTSAPSSSPTSSEVWHLQASRPNSAVLPAAHLPSHLALCRSHRCNPVVIPAQTGLPIAPVSPAPSWFASATAAGRRLKSDHETGRRFPVRSVGHDPTAGCSGDDVVPQSVKFFHLISPDGTGSRWLVFCLTVCTGQRP